jgi:hypothetical protein
VGKEGHEKGVVQKFPLFHQPLIGIDKKRYLGNSKKAYAEGKDYVQKGKVRLESLIDVTDKKIHVFEIAEENNVYRDPENKQCPVGNNLFLQGVIIDDQAGDCVIKQDRTQDQRQIADIPPSVIKERREQKPGVGADGQSLFVQDKVNYQGHRQKEKNKCVRIKQHTGKTLPPGFIFSSFFRSGQPFRQHFSVLAARPWQI